MRWGKILRNHLPPVFVLLLSGLLYRLILAYFYPYDGRPAKKVITALYIQQNLRFPVNQFAQQLPFSRPPLAQLLYSLPLFVYDGRVGIHRLYFLIPPLFGILTILVFYKLVERIYNKTVALTAAMILVFHQYFLQISVYATIEIIITFLFVTGCYLYIVYIDTEKLKYLYGAFAIAGLAGLTKIYGPALFLIIGLDHLYRKRLTRIKHLVAAGTTSATLFGFWIVRNIYYYGHPYPRTFGFKSHSTVSPELLTFTEAAMRIIVDYILVMQMRPVVDDKIPFLIPLIIFFGLITFGILIYGYSIDREQNKYNNFFTLWIITMTALMVVAHLLNPGVKPKWRHLGTLTPYSALLLSLAYRSLYDRFNEAIDTSALDVKLRDLYYPLLIVLLVLWSAQVGLWVGVQYDQYQANEEPVVNYVFSEIEEDKRIYSDRQTYAMYTGRPTSFVVTSLLMNRNLNLSGNLSCEVTKVDYLILEPNIKNSDKKIREEIADKDRFKRVAHINGTVSIFNPDALHTEVFKNTGDRATSCR